MTPDERNDDIISEQTFSKEQAKNENLDDRKLSFGEEDFDELDSAVSPQADSPGDSEVDATAEFMIGINFRPESEDAFEEDEEDGIEDFEKSDRTVYAEQKSSSASETPSLDGAEFDSKKNANESAQVISSGRPSPRSDAGSSTSTN